MRFVHAVALVTALTAVPAIAGAAPPTAKKCIENAESGQQLRAAGKLSQARKAFSICTAIECPTAIRRDCGRWNDELDSAIPTISVRLEDETGAEGHGKILLDNETFQPDPGGLATRIDPGVHHFSWQRSADGSGKPVEVEVTLREGEKNRVIVLRADAQPATAPVKGTIVIPPPGQDEKEPGPGALPWIVGGLGVVAGGIGVGMWVSGLDKKSTLENTCLPTNSCSTSDVDRSRTSLIVGDILFGVGVVAVGTAIYLLLKSPSAAPTHTASQ